MYLQEVLIENCQKAIVQLYETELSHSDFVIQPTRKEFKGSHTITCFQLSKKLGIAPDQIGNALGDWLQNNCPFVSAYSVVKGFLNIELSHQYVIQSINERILSSLLYKPSEAVKSEKVMVEYSSPNTNKPLHLGHLRNNFLGYSLAEILKAYGYQVVKANLVNDRGIHICKSMLAYKLLAKGETPQSSGLKGDKLVGKYYVEFDRLSKEYICGQIEQGVSEEDATKSNPYLAEAQELLQKWEAGDAETIQLWSTMNGWVYQGFDQTYKSIGVDFDHTYYESNTYLLGKDIVAEGLQTGAFYQKEDGSVWIDLTEEGLDHKLLLRKDGTSVYITQDMGTADLKFKDYGAKKSIYVVGNEQDYHFKVLFLVLKRLKRSYADGLYHLSYGMVDLPSGKMKSREGTVVDADDLVQEMIDTARENTEALGKIDDFSSEEAQSLYRILGLGALKYFLLKVDPGKRMLFNPQESIDFHGHTGPFIQYTHARICSILRKAETLQLGYKGVMELPVGYTMLESEKNIVLTILNYPSMLTEAANNYTPSLVANYVYEVAKLYNSYYAEASILQASEDSVKLFRITLSYHVSKTIAECMKLLGIEVPHRM